MMKATAVLALAASASAFVPSSRSMATVRSARPSAKVAPVAAGTWNGGAFEEGMSKFKEDFPFLAEYGWGPTTKAERWNGRHAMAGWLFIVITGYVQSHGLIPNADKALDAKVWGTLSYLYAPNTITNLRATVLVGNIHMLMVSILAAINPPDWMDKLLLEPGEPDEPPAGLIPDFETGLTPAAEMMNGRVAMFGLILLIGASLITGTPMIDIVNTCVGGLLYAK